VAFNLRNTTVDRRRLSAEDRASYRPQQRQMALARAQQRRGQLAWNEHREQRTREARPGSGGFTGGIGIQQQRLREEGAKLARAEQLRNEGSIYVEDPN